MRKLLILLALLCSGCAANKLHIGAPPTQTQREYYITRYWSDAQEMLEDKTNGASVCIPHDIFKWHWKSDLIMWRGEIAYGLFTRGDGGHIYIWQWRPWTIKHEACHAILAQLGYLDWKSYCHEGSEWK